MYDNTRYLYFEISHVVVVVVDARFWPQHLAKTHGC